MEIGMIGLGRMGGNMAQRLLEGGHHVVAYDQTSTSVQRLAAKGAAGVDSPASLVNRLAPPRAIWLMVPAGDPVDHTIDGLTPQLEPGDTIVDGGNSNYKDTLRRSASLAKQRIHLVDVGTSGGGCRKGTA